ncbi:hypothetical protein M2324_003279 [Rhodovulum sulfidophilum]|uniref:glycoside hydrolase family protein n=1 Tax=Rhodovulum sulfidophilum TaxID=35806 RepID=UPI0005ED005C|nr:glycoside hydrolase family protein [Rhodovulum sulfidophilum]MCW2304865.1 hypothetical protein [Rhodovulum sulfidophilum]
MRGQKPKLDNVVPMKADQTVPVPEAPDWMSAEGRDAWERLAPELAAKRRLDPTYHDPFAIYCEAVADVIRFTGDIAAFGSWYEVEIPDRTYVAILDWAYNVGLGAAARSTLIRKLNAGDLRGACDELPRWRFAGGKGIRGLLIRRNKARQLCHEGLDGVPADVPFRWGSA